MKMKSFFIGAGLLCAMPFLAFADSKTDTPPVLSMTDTAAPTENSEKSMPASTIDQDITDPFNNGAEDAVQDNTTTPTAEVGPQNVLDPVLQGLAIGPTKATAVISDKTYVQGDEARNGIELVEVRKKEADIKVEGIKRTIRLVPEFKKIKKSDPVTPHANDAVSPKSEASFLAADDAAMSEKLLTEKSGSEQGSLLAAKEESK